MSCRTPAARARFAVGERIRDRIAAHKFLAGDGLDIRLTASVGVATLPDVAASAEELMQAADAAMYQVKDRGKNGIQAAALQPITDARRQLTHSALRCRRSHFRTSASDVRSSVESSFDAFVVLE